MKQLILFLAFSFFLLAGCSEKEITSDVTDSISTNSADSVQSASLNDDSRTYYNYSELIHKEGVITLVTNGTPVYSDSLLQYASGVLLNAEEHITIEKHCGITTKNNWIEPVYKIAYKTNADVVYGYVSQSHIACRVDTLKSQNLVTLTLDYNKSKNKFIGKVALLNRGWDIIGTASVVLDIPLEGDAPYSYTYSFSFRENDACGLEKIEEIFSISTDYGACGYPNFEYTFLWNGTQLIDCPETFSVSEAGLFNQYSYLVFPGDSLGKKGSILEIIEAKEYTEAENSDNVIVNKDSTVVEYKWNMNTFKITRGDTLAKKSRTYSTTY